MELQPESKPLPPQSEGLVNGVQAQGYEELNPVTIAQPPAAQPESPAVIEVGERSPVEPVVQPQSELEKALLDKVNAIPEVQPPQFDSPEMEAFNTQFKQYMGVDLKEAYQTFQTAQERLQQMEQQSQQSQVQEVSQQLRSVWGVNDAEVARRAQVISEFAADLSPTLRSELDTVEGIQLAWRVISQDSTPAISRLHGGSAPAKPTFTRAQLQDMMINNPVEYSARQAEITLAYNEGRVN